MAERTIFDNVDTFVQQMRDRGQVPSHVEMGTEVWGWWVEEARQRGYQVPTEGTDMAFYFPHGLGPGVPIVHNPHFRPYRMVVRQQQEADGG